MRGVNWVLHTRIQIECLLCVSSNCDSLNFFFVHETNSLMFMCNSGSSRSSTGRTCGCLCQNDDDAEMIGPWLLFSTKFSMADLLTDWLTDFYKNFEKLEKEQTKRTKWKEKWPISFRNRNIQLLLFSVLSFLDSIILANKNVQYVFVSFIFWKLDFSCL